MVDPGTEVIIGVKRDPSFGPVVMFGMGGIHVELYKDVIFRVAPLNEADCEDMINGIKASKLLKGFRGSPPMDMEALKKLCWLFQIWQYLCRRSANLTLIRLYCILKEKDAVWQTLIFY